MNSKLLPAILLLILTCNIYANDDCAGRSELLKLKSTQEKFNFPDEKKSIEISYINNDNLIKSKSGIFNISIKGEEPKYRYVFFHDRTSMKNKSIEENMYFNINPLPRNEVPEAYSMASKLISYNDFFKLVADNCFLSIGKTKREQEDYLRKKKYEKERAERVKKNEAVKRKLKREKKMLERERILERERMIAKTKNDPKSISKTKLEKKLKKNPKVECEKLNDYSGNRGDFMSIHSEGLSVFLRRKNLRYRANPEEEKENLKVSEITDDFMIDGNKGYFFVKSEGDKYRIKKVSFENGKSDVINWNGLYENKGLEVEYLKKIIRYPCFIKIND